MPERAEAYRVNHGALIDLFPCVTALPDRPSSVSCEAGSFSRAHLLLRSSFVRASFWPLSRPSALPGFFPSSRRCPKPSTCTGAHLLPLSSTLRFSQPLGGLLRLRPLRAYSIPQPRPGLFRPGGSPDSQPPQLIAGSCPHEVGSLPLTGCHEDCQLPLPVTSPSRLCSANRCVLQGRGLAFPSVAPLLGFCPPSGLRRRSVYPVPRAIRS